MIALIWNVNIALNVFKVFKETTIICLGTGSGELMWLDQLIINIQEQEMLLYEARWEKERYERINQEYLSYGREYLLKKYHSNLTYVYKYLNSNAYQYSLESYQFVKEKYDHMQRTLELITIFHPDRDLISPRYYVNEEEREWKNERAFSR